ncbi:hypothetical protein BDQ12DRAFT_676386 [Crucibulum laeve]|uniref:Uncharacterized protein n=1 Tax=Crucibulum laeve TaxID=68775 RepID=A0A5C3MBH2_9AGAR|nr:hypothetical protein BDQ12DRAFT_676386 [Crucibulum laeve]
MLCSLPTVRPSAQCLRRLQQPLRSLYASARRCDRVAPPDPISHMRPIIYDDAPSPSPPALLRHPYSLSEFSSTKNKVGDHELQYKFLRQQLDAFHQNFWLNSNIRFEAAKAAILDSLPPSATSIDKENALSEFYKQWVMQEKNRTDAYTTEWRKQNFSLIMLSTRVKYHRFISHISSILTFKKAL